jgi:hypothetical protein
MKDMKVVNIDLGNKPENYTQLSEPMSKTYYPTFTVEEEGDIDLPDEGVMLVKFCKVRSSSEQRPGETKRYSCTVEVKEIVSVKEVDIDKAPKRSREQDLDEKMSEVMKGKKSSDDEEDDY